MISLSLSPSLPMTMRKMASPSGRDLVSHAAAAASRMAFPGFAVVLETRAQRTEGAMILPYLCYSRH